MRRGSGLLGLPLLAALILVVLVDRAPGGSAYFARGDYPNHAADNPVTILVYHRFGPTVADSMTVRTSSFRWQLTYLAAHGYVVVPLRTVVAHLLGDGPPPPARAVVITADDGHESVFTEMWPVVRERGVPVTLFVYPSAISNAAYAMTWSQLATLTASGLFDIQSHTYWHPNFAVEKRRLSPEAYRAFAARQLCRSSAVLRSRLGVATNVVAWPFGIYDEELFPVARDCGYSAGVTLSTGSAAARGEVMAIPRSLVTDAATGARFAAMLPSEADR